MEYSKYMDEALVLAKEAFLAGEVPVGAVIVKDGEIIGKGRNSCEIDKSPVSHAEINAINQACKNSGTWRLNDCVMFVTLEPCAMCAGAIINSRIDKIVFSAYDEKAGAFSGMMSLKDYSIFNNLSVIGGYKEKKSISLLSSFFEKRRREQLK